MNNVRLPLPPTRAGSGNKGSPKPAIAPQPTPSPFGTSGAGAVLVSRATSRDLEQIMRFGIEFHRELVDPALPMDVRSLAVYVSSTLSNLAAAIFLAHEGKEPVGMAGALFFPLFFDHAHLTGQELWWYVSPGHRSTGAGEALLEALEDEARARGAKSFSMISLASGRKTLDAFYRSKGYKRQQTIFVKTI